MRSRYSSVLHRSTLGGSILLALAPAALALVGVFHQSFWSWLSTISAWVAVGSFAVSLLLMVRVRWLDVAFGGLARMYRYHHAFGTAAFVAMLVHPLALAARALAAGATEVVQQLLWPNTQSLVILSGWLTLASWMIWMIATVTTQLPYRTWRLIHRAGAVLFPLLLWHLLGVALPTPAWMLGLSLLGASVLAYAYRIGFANRATHGRPYSIVEVAHPRPDMVELVLEPEGEALHYKPGQFVYLALLDSPSYRACGELHPYTPTSDPAERRLRLSIKGAGDCTKHIQEVSVGGKALVQGPFGGLFPAQAAARGQVWIAGGLGIAAFLSRAASLHANDGAVDLLYATPSADLALYLAPLRELARTRPNLRVHVSYDDRDGRLTCERIVSKVGLLAQRDVVLAGPLAMIEALEASLRECGVPAASIHTERGVLQ